MTDLALDLYSKNALGSDAYRARIAQLSARSVTKHFDAYADVDWDHAAYRVEPDDPRWQKGPEDPLGATEWYRSQSEATRARIGLHHVAAQMKIGIEFEAVLARGLLNFAARLPNGAPEFRYAYHEIIEEGQHSLMFQEFVNRAGLPVRGLTGIEAFGARFVPRLGATFPELFFLFVLGGEAPIDDVQRRALAGAALHPLLRRVMQIHVTEEARHLCFAKAYLLERVPALSPFARWQLKVRAPLILAVMARGMLKPPEALIRHYRIPAAVVREAYGGPAHAEQLVRSVEPVRVLCHRLGLLSGSFESLWRRLGIAPSRDDLDARRFPRPGVVRALPAAWFDVSRDGGGT
jgi:hypothetical protein